MNRKRTDASFQHLDALDRLLKDWEIYAKKFNVQDITEKRYAFHEACHAMMQAIQQALDLAGEIIVAYDVMPRPETYAGAFETLGRRLKWPSDLTKRLADLARFRNVLVHQYGNLDLKKVHAHLRNSSAHLRRFQKSALQLIRKKR